MTDYLDRTIDFSDPDIASVYDELSYWSSQFGALLLRHLELVRGIHVLDVGCGTGFPLFELAHMHGASCRLTGVDIWQEALDRAEMKRQVYGLANVRLLRADGAQLPFPDAQFDLIVSNLGVNNFADPRAALAECARAAKAGARLVLTTNLQGHMREFYEVFRETLNDLDKTEYLERLAANEHHRATKESLTERMEESGFHVVRFFEDRFDLRYLDGSTLLRHRLTRLGFLEGWRKVLDPPDEEVVFAALEQRLNERARQQGELRMTVPMLYVEGRRR